MAICVGTAVTAVGPGGGPRCSPLASSLGRLGAGGLVRAVVAAIAAVGVDSFGVGAPSEVCGNARRSAVPPEAARAGGIVGTSGGPQRGAVLLCMALSALGVAQPYPQLEPPTQMVAGAGGGAGWVLRRVVGVGVGACG